MPKFGDYTASTAPNQGDLLLIKDINTNSTKKITRSNLLVGTALPTNTVTTAAISNSAVTSDKIATDSQTISYYEGTAGFSTTSSTTVDAGSMTITFTTPASCTKIFLKLEATISNTDGASTNTFQITDASNNVQLERKMQTGQSNANALNIINMSRRITVTASTSYTFKARYSTSSGTLVVNQGNSTAHPYMLWADRA